MTLESKQFDYLAWLTGVAVLALLGGALWALITKEITFAVFSGVVGTPVATLIGWWARGAAVGERS